MVPVIIFDSKKLLVLRFFEIIFEFPSKIEVIKMNIKLSITHNYF